MVRQRPIVMAIVGDSGAGKTTITRGLTNLLGRERVTHVCSDDYHRYDRRERAERGITALHPDCNYLDILELHVERLHYGQPILKPVYDHATGTLVRPQYVQPREFVIVEGLLTTYTGVLRQFFDIKVFLDPPEALRRVWKVRRDTIRRGYSPEQVLEELARREPDMRAYIAPQREHADLVVRFAPPPGTDAEDAGPHLDVQLILRPTIPHPDLSNLFDGEPVASPAVRLRLARDGGRPVDILEVDGNATAEHAAQLREAVWRHLPGLAPIPPDQFGGYNDRGEPRHSDPLALTQLILIYHLLRERDGITLPRFARPVAALSRLQVPQPAPAAE